MRFTALIPSYRRPDSLVQCLEGLLAGERQPDEIVVVLRDTDEESRERLTRWLRGQGQHAPVKVVPVSLPGQINAINAGLAAVTGDIVGFPDDDCIPRPDWLRRILSHYTSDAIGGVGGRDVVHETGLEDPPTTTTAGKLTWYGRIIGNHHLNITGPPRPVDHLKGVNMTFRRELLHPFDTNIRGPHFNDTDAALSVRGQGKTLILDPEAKVDHYPAPRADNPGGRNLLDPRLIALDNHDWSYLVLKHMALWQKPVAMLYIMLVGTHLRPGILTACALALRSPKEAWARLVPVLSGSFAGMRTYLQYRKDRKTAQ